MQNHEWTSGGAAQTSARIQSTNRNLLNNTEETMGTFSCSTSQRCNINIPLRLKDEATSVVVSPTVKAKTGSAAMEQAVETIDCDAE